MNRRHLLQLLTATAAFPVTGSAASRRLELGNPKLQFAFEAALHGLKANLDTVTRFPRPVLLEGATYAGVWLECAPFEGLVFSAIAPQVEFGNQIALANHEVFFDLQREDGYIPYSVKRAKIGSGQIQMVVPIAATAWDVYRQTKEAIFLDKAYAACVRWDEWLARYRDTRNTGLCEAFCEYDTGHDNSPRFRGLPRTCPDGDARLCPQVDGLPFLAPDLSATVYGGRTALASMARELGRKTEEARWLDRAGTIRAAILDKLFDAREGAFYDIDAHGEFVRIRGDVISRVLGEHVPDIQMFEEVYRKQMHNPSAFWTPYPFPSIAADDREFVRPHSRNTWSGASQALTALRASRWMEHYGKHADLHILMQRWVDALVRSGAFLQQMDPFTGEFTPDTGGYSPAMLMLADSCWRLYGVRAVPAGLEWNCRLPMGSSAVSAMIPTPRGDAHLQNAAPGATLLLGGIEVAKVRGIVRLVTSEDGTLLKLVNIEPTRVSVEVMRRGRKTSYVLEAGAVVPAEI